MRPLLRFPLLLCTLAAPAVPAVDLDAAGLQAELTRVAAGVDGRLGVCVQSGSRTACLRGEERFSLQSVMKLVAGAALLDAVDRGRARLDDVVTVRTADLSVFVQPLAALVGPSGYRTTVGDLVRRAVIDSDSAAVDILIARLGGPSTVQAFLSAKAISGIRIDRDERHLQTATVGLTWRPEYVDAAVLEHAISTVPHAVRSAAYAQYQADARDTATPAGMASFLLRLAQGDLLSRSSTDFLLKAMSECRTFPDRLKAGVSAGWQLSHKTGTSGSWENVTAATNDVGILTAPGGSQIAVAVFVADSRSSAALRAATIAKIAAAVIANCR